ncbi:MAG: phosphatidate cytidylyltransferase [Bacteroidales bacterium]|nr:phosphatidate cytidylyltransferase [Bacteroidales bacterium]
MHNLYTRTITGIIFVALIIGSLILHPLAFVAVIFILMIAALMEFFHLANNNEVHPQKMVGFAAGSIIYIIPAFIALEMISAIYLAFLPLLIIFIFVAEIFRNKPNSLQNLAFSIFPIAYISIPLSMLIFLMSPLVTGNQPHWHIAFSFFIILWSHDTFAYLTGMALGKHKLFEKISPKKTWEGTIGGTIFGLIAAFVLSLFFKELNTWQWLAGAMIITITGTLGDLSESLLKRKFNVKDSGNFFPGHGGVLDRFDAVLFSAPALFCYLILLNL